MNHFSPWGYLFFTLWALLAGILAEGWQLAGLASLELAFGLAWSRKGLRLLRRYRFWVFILTAVALGSLLGKDPAAASRSLHVSRGGWKMGVGMAGRAFVMSLAFSVGISALSLSDITAMFDRLHLRGLGFALGLAANLLGTLREISIATMETIRLRGGMRRPIVGLRLFLVTLVSNTLRYGDQIVNAAAVRAFDPNEGQTTPLPLWRSDVGLLIVLGGFSVGLLAL